LSNLRILHLLDKLQCSSDNSFDRLQNLQAYGKENCFSETEFVLFASAFHTIGNNSKLMYHDDAFVSYSSKDEGWVINGLEQQGHHFRRLCLHSRDFQLGKDIAENITDSLCKGCQTFCLISHNYLLSHWCSLEMDLSLWIKVSAKCHKCTHQRLAQLVKTRTYLDWPRTS
uniref:TIR domain-containing protein n=1 Tax=Electrophorus electricus TaxID=8005 RepID=A0AAY5EM10_ELEEL